MTRLFHQVVRPLATAQTPGAFLRGLREWQWMEQYLMYRIARQMPEFLDTQQHVLGLKPPFRALRLVLLIEAGTHLIVDAIIVSIPHW